MDAFDNPFRPGAGTPPPALIGRDELIEKYDVALRRALTGRPGKSLMPIGLRGVGKTVLLNRFQEIARSRLAHRVHRGIGVR
jgi:Cdc6-like AAA superfamily ATPase